MLVAFVVVAVSAGALVAVAACSGRALLAARRDAAATTFAVASLEGLRAGPRLDGVDVVASSGTSYQRGWTVTNGRGLPDRIEAVVDWPGHRLALGTEALP